MIRLASFLCSQRLRSSIQSAKTRPGADCGSVHELLIAKFRHKLKKVRKATGTFRYGLNQIPYDYAVDMANICKTLDLIDTVPEELLMEVHNVQEAVIKTIPKKRKCKEEDLQIAEKRRKAQGKGEKERYIHLNAEIRKPS